MSLEINSGKGTFVNVKEGKLYTKEKGKEPQFFDAISGVIVGVGFKKDEYQGKPYEKMELTIMDGEERYILQMRTDSGYFRGFCNSLKTGNPTERVRIAPSSKIVEDKPQTTCFVSQNNQPLKHAFTLANPGELPPMEKVNFKGQQFWDGSKQIDYWKNWLTSIQWQHPLLASEKQPQEINRHEPIAAEETYEDDLPF